MNDRERRSELFAELKELNAKIFKASQYLYKLKERHSKVATEYEELDRKLALRDGRYTVITKKRKEVKVKLTLEQLYDIAAELGVDLNDKE
jgi:chromosome segregation ATPase